MASIREDFVIEAHPDVVWDAVRDVGNLHRRLLPGFVVDAWLEDGARVVVFSNGMQLRELIVDIDDTLRRFSYAAIGGKHLHHHASIEVMPAGSNRSRLLWTIDVLPETFAASGRALAGQAALIMKQTIEAHAPRH